MVLQVFQCSIIFNMTSQFETTKKTVISTAIAVNTTVCAMSEGSGVPN